MEATVRHRGGAGVSGYGGFAACRVTRSTSELSERSPHERSHDRSPGAAPEAAAPEVAALEKTLKQLQLQVPACNEACNPACRSPQPQPATPACIPRASRLRACVCVRVSGGGRGDPARGRRCAQRRARSLSAASWGRHSAAARQRGSADGAHRLLGCLRTDKESPSPRSSHRHEAAVAPSPACASLSPRAVLSTQARSSRWRRGSRRRTPTPAGGMPTPPRPRSRDASRPHALAPTGCPSRSACRIRRPRRFLARPCSPRLAWRELCSFCAVRATGSGDGIEVNLW